MEAMATVFFGVLLQHLLELSMRGLRHLVVLRRFRAGNVLLHVRGGQIQTRGGKPGIEFHGLLKCSTASGYWASVNACTPLFELIARLELVAADAEDRQRGHSENQTSPCAYYCPASTLAVIRPTLSIPAPWAMSIALATHWNSRIGIALDEDHALGAGLEDLFEARSQPCLIGGLAVDQHVVILVDHDDHGALIRWFGVCVGRRRLGHQRLQPFGVSGVITMKMMISTSSTSIIGVMLMSAFGPPLRRLPLP